MFTKEQVTKMLEEERVNLEKIGIPISKDICPEIRFAKATSWYGMCEPRRYHNGRMYKFRICFSEYHLASDEKSVRNTIIHELLHTCPDCLNHGPKWQKYAAVVNAKMSYDIKRCGGDKESAAESLAKGREEKYGMGHLLECKKCGAQWKRTRHSNFTLHPERYTCRCGGGIELKY